MSVFPFTTFRTESRAEEELKLFSDVAYDFEKNCLLLKAGQPYMVYKDAAIKIWIYKALGTKRYIWQAYTHAYGNELEELVGKASDRGVFESEAQRYITECLMVNPYIQELSDFKFEYANKITVAFEVTTVYGRFTYESEVYNE